MKKVLALTLAVIMMLTVLVSCNDKDETPAQTTAAETTTAATTADPAKPLSDKLYVGYGRANITPRDENGSVMPVKLSGYPDERIANKIISDLFTSCTAVRDEEGDTVLLFTVDSLHPYAELIGNIRTRVSRATGISAKNIIITATHNHSAPEVNEGMNDASRRYLENIFYKGFVDAGKAAIEDIALCTELYTGTLDGTGLNFIRRYVVDRGKLKHEIEGDHTMPVIRFVREGKKDVILANWSAHCDTTTLQDFYAVSGDFYYYFTQLAEEKLNAHVSLFNGNSGDVNPFSRIESENVFGKNSRAIGRGLAQVLIDNISTLQKINIVGDVEVSTKSLKLEVEHSRDADKAKAEEVLRLFNAGDGGSYSRKCKEYGISDYAEAIRIITNCNRGATENMPVSAVSLGNIVFATAGYEMLTKTGMDIRANSKFDFTFVCGYTNGHNGYIPAEYSFPNGAYEVGSCRYIKGTAEKIQAELNALMDKLHADIYG